ncbi:hypothetical protein RJ641_032755 [Dillenia turbinata]|uniref:Clp R domain-containing protein n=1 Tax=Dillenia turbinata TaxID=194707 RepID=A0AAN8VK99_9MAGN
MPTPVGTARQCLTDEAARALDDAVAVARRRNHAQTTSLHAVSALLALPSSTLRDACSRARSSAYLPRLQFRALELSVGVSLDRLPTSKSVDEPPISNSLMAAIKRSQANQRRHPESFHMHQLQQQQQSSLSCVKVELKHFILSILDDPIVSRVFGEAGFGSADIKLSLLHPPSSSRFSRPRCPPLFLCNFTSGFDSDPTPLGFPFPFPGFSGSPNGDANSRRIAGILTKSERRNPLLVGICANEALRSFSDSVERNRDGVLPEELKGLKIIYLEKVLCEFLNGTGTEELMDLKFKEVGQILETCSGPGIVLGIGELKSLVDDGVSMDAVNRVVAKLTELLKFHWKKLWLIGAASGDDTYSKFLNRFPEIEKDWDLNLLPITSFMPSIEGFSSKPSLMGSFVPFGGFFTSPADFKIPLTCKSIAMTQPRCHLCNEKYEQEASAMRKGGAATSVADQHSEKLPSWLQMAELDTNKGLDTAKAKDDSTALNAKLIGLEKKWNDICLRLHQTQPCPLPVNSQLKSDNVCTDSRFVSNLKESNSRSSSLDESGYENQNLSLPVDTQNISPPRANGSISPLCGVKNADLHQKVSVSISLQLEANVPPLSRCTLPNLSVPLDNPSPSSVTSVTTDLGLGTLYAPICHEPKNSRLQDHSECVQNRPGSVSTEHDDASENSSYRRAKISSCCGLDSGGQLDPKDFKSLWGALTEKVGRQDEAICLISHTVTRCRMGNEKFRGAKPRRDVWLHFLGCDIVGKRKIAAALAEILFGSRENLIFIDLRTQGGISNPLSLVCRQDLNGYDARFRGKTVVDFIATELCKKPHSVVFLENIDSADLLAQSSLSQAIRTGKFPDSHRREISISDTIFVTTSTKNSLYRKEGTEYTEERILRAKNCQIKIIVESISGDTTRSGIDVNVLANRESEVNSTGPQEPSEFQERACKRSRKTFLDLNLPVQGIEEDCGYVSCESDSISENSEAWLEEFYEQVDEKVELKPFDFDSRAKKLMEKIMYSFRETMGSKCLLEVHPEVMGQLLAAAWLSDRMMAVEDWIDQVMCRSFVEARQKYGPAARTMIKLVACENLFVEEHAPGICLPARIVVN